MATALTDQPQLSPLLDRPAAERSRRMLVLLGGIWVMNLFDASLTVTAHSQGLLHELNPLANHILAYQPTLVYSYKLGLVLLGSCILWQLRRWRSAELAAWVLLLTYVGVCLHWDVCYKFFCSPEFADDVLASGLLPR